jgi:hypothetical protein
MFRFAACVCFLVAMSQAYPYARDVNTPSVSILLQVRDEAPFLAEALASLRRRATGHPGFGLS